MFTGALRGYDRRIPAIASARVLVFALGMILTAARLLSQPTAADWPIKEQLKISGDGSERGDIEPVSAAMVGTRGDLFVVQSRANHVKHYSKAGKLLGLIGRAGDGPGEFRAISGLGRVADTLWVADQRHRRISFFLFDGTLVRSEPDRVNRGRTALAGVLVDGIRISTALEIATSGRDSSLQAVIRVHDSNGAELREIRRLPTKALVQKIVVPNVGTTSVTLPFSDRPLVGVDPKSSQIVLLEGNSPTSPIAKFSLSRWGSSGQKLSSAFGTIPSFKVREALIDSMVAEMMQRATNGRGASPDLSKALKAAMFTGGWVPPFGKMMVAGDGLVWAQRSDDVSKLIAIGDRAQIVGTITLPKRTVALAVDASDIWAMQFDAFDVPELVRFTIERRKSP